MLKVISIFVPIVLGVVVLARSRSSLFLLHLFFVEPVLLRSESASWFDDCDAVLLYSVPLNLLCIVH